MAYQTPYHYKQSSYKRRIAKKEYRTVLLSLGLFIAVTSLIFFIGIPLIGKSGEIFSELLQGNQPILVKKDTLAPNIPYLESLPQGIKDKIIQVKGLAEPGATAVLNLNGENIKEALVDGQGNFIFEYVPLKEGENRIYVTAKDETGNVSEKSKELVIIHKSTAPKLEISQPTENQVFKDVSNPIKITGITDPSAKVYINDTLAVVDSNGNFEKYITLRDEGKNTIKFKAVDIAGNETIKEVTIIFQKK